MIGKKKGILARSGDSFDWDIQRYTVSSWSGSNPSTNVILLTTSVPVGESFAMISHAASDNTGVNVFATAELTTVSGGDWTEVLVRIHGANGFQIQVEVQVVTSPFFSVQKKVDYTAVDASIPIDVPITSVDTSKTFIVGSASTGDDIRTNAVFFQLEASTNVIVDKGAVFSNDVAYCFYVVEITIAGASVIHGKKTITGGDGVVDPSASDNTFCLFTWAVGSSDSCKSLVRGVWNSNSEYEWIRNTISGTLEIYYFFVTIPDTTVERISDFPGDIAEDTYHPVTINSVTTGKAFVAHGGYLNNSSHNSTEGIREGLVSQRLGSSTTVEQRRNKDSTSAIIQTEIQIVSI